MNTSSNDIALLWDYLDGELSQDQAALLEERLEKEPHLQEQLKEVKALRREVKTLSEVGLKADNFTDKVIDRLENGSASSFRDYLFHPYTRSAVAVLLVFLLVGAYFFAPSSFTLSKSSGALVSGLVPHFQQRDISKKEVLDFGLYNRLPLDKQQKQFLKLEVKKGKRWVKFIKSNAVTSSQHSYRQLKQTLDRRYQKGASFDSVLTYYARRLKKTGLYKTHDTLAVADELWRVNRALVKDLARCVPSPDFRSSLGINNASVPRAIAKNPVKNDTFILIKWDTTAAAPQKVQVGTLAHDPRSARVAIRLLSIRPDKNDSKSSPPWNLTIATDSPLFSVQLPALSRSLAEEQERVKQLQDAIRTQLEQFSFELRLDTTAEKRGMQINVLHGKDGTGRYQFSFPYMNEVDSFIAHKLQHLDSIIDRESRIVKVKADSIIFRRSREQSQKKWARISDEQGEEEKSELLLRMKKKNKQLQQQIDSLRERVKKMKREVN